MFRDARTAEADYTSTVELDMATVVPSLAGPKRPQDRVPLTDVQAAAFIEALAALQGRSASCTQPRGRALVSTARQCELD